MEGSFLAGPFHQVLVRYGLAAALLALIFLALVILAFMYGRAKINLMQSEQATNAAERAREAQDRATDTARRNAEISRLHEQQNTIMVNHLEHDRHEREALVKVLSEISAKDDASIQTMRAIADDLKNHREEESRRSAEIHKQLNDIQLDIAKGMK